MGDTKNELRKASGTSFEAQNWEMKPMADLNRGKVRTNRANEDASPTHNARTTMAYSVSFPVCIA